MKKNFGAKSAAIVGWIFYGTSIFLSLSAIPLLVATAFMEMNGPISSNDTPPGDGLIIIPIYVFVPGLLGFSLLLLSKHLLNKPKKYLMKGYSILASIHFISVALIWLMTLN